MSQLAALSNKVKLAPVEVHSVETGEDLTTPFLPEKPVSTDQKPPVSPVDTGKNPALSLLSSGPAPDPATEIPINPEPDVEKMEEGENRFRHIAFDSASNDNAIKYVGGDVKTGKVKLSVTTEAEFIEFWAVDAWEMLSGVAMLFRLDISDIETGEHELKQGKKAAKHLYKLAHKYPKVLGWMLAEATLSGGDVLICAAFFGGKVSSAVGIYQNRKPPEQITSGIVGGGND